MLDSQNSVAYSQFMNKVKKKKKLNEFTFYRYSYRKHSAFFIRHLYLLAIF